MLVLCDSHDQSSDSSGRFDGRAGRKAVLMEAGNRQAHGGAAEEGIGDRWSSVGITILGGREIGATPKADILKTSRRGGAGEVEKLQLRGAGGDRFRRRKEPSMGDDATVKF
ncbi:hypothetical protein GOBAR_AA38708 [Gossypium barbadense]|uniref:Uncharacterized protein n=1 Tax=Gossypium barbadense TaxID=3634 RepID=A0A2P5VT31_GOSBA|nr:hypothetical protein GOBAR_AA38708 [Gossypium barbadense]